MEILWTMYFLSYVMQTPWAWVIGQWTGWRGTRARRRLEAGRGSSCSIRRRARSRSSSRASTSTSRRTLPPWSARRPISHVGCITSVTKRWVALVFFISIFTHPLVFYFTMRCDCNLIVLDAIRFFLTGLTSASPFIVLSICWRLIEKIVDIGIIDIGIYKGIINLGTLYLKKIHSLRKIRCSSYPSGVLVAPIFCGRIYTFHRSRWCSHKSSHYPLRSSRYSFLRVLAASTCWERHLTSKRRSRYSPRVVRAPFQRTGYCFWRLRGTPNFSQCSFCVLEEQSFLRKSESLLTHRIQSHSVVPKLYST